MALVAFWPTAAWADTIGVPLTDGTLKLPAQVGFSFDSDSRLVATGPDFSFVLSQGHFLLHRGVFRVFVLRGLPSMPTQAFLGLLVVA
jgi:hypothetical protein